METSDDDDGKSGAIKVVTIQSLNLINFLLSFFLYFHVCTIWFLFVLPQGKSEHNTDPI